MGIEPTGGLSPGRPTVLKTASPSDANPFTVEGLDQINDPQSLSFPYGPDGAPELAEIMEAWSSLPEAIRAGIVAMVRASKPSRPG